MTGVHQFGIQILRAECLKHGQERSYCRLVCTLIAKRKREIDSRDRPGTAALTSSRRARSLSIRAISFAPVHLENAIFSDRLARSVEALACIRLKPTSRFCALILAD